jgi:hypothetical protein
MELNLFSEKNKEKVFVLSGFYQNAPSPGGYKIG